MNQPRSVNPFVCCETSNLETVLLSFVPSSISVMSYKSCTQALYLCFFSVSPSLYFPAQHQNWLNILGNQPRISPNHVTCCFRVGCQKVKRKIWSAGASFANLGRSESLAAMEASCFKCQTIGREIQSIF